MFRKAQVWIMGRTPRAELRVLLFKLTEERGGHWQPVTGGLDDGESFPDGALREAREETGFRFRGKPRSLDHEFRFEGRWGPAVERAFLLQVPGRGAKAGLLAPRLDPREHVAAAWALPEEALQLVPFEAQRQGLRRALARLRA